MNNKIRHFIFILYVIFLFAGWGWCGEEVKTGPVDFTIDPILSSEWVCYIQDGDLYIRNIENGPIKVRSSKERAGAIMSPDLKAAGNSIFVAWIE